MADYGLEVFDPFVLQTHLDQEAKGEARSPTLPADSVPSLPDGEKLEYRWDGTDCEAFDSKGNLVGRFHLQMVGGRYIYNDALADFIAECVVDGKGFREIATLPAMPRALALQNWFNTKKDFREKVLLARQLRAAEAARMAVEKGSQAASLSKDFVPGTRLAVETLQWAAEKFDPETFGSRTKVVGDVNAPLSLIIETGIRRVGDPGFQVGGMNVVGAEGAGAVPPAASDLALPSGDAEDVAGDSAQSLPSDAGACGPEVGTEEDSDSTS